MRITHNSASNSNTGTTQHLFNTTMTYAFDITRYHNGRIESVSHNVEEYPTEREAIEGARRYAAYWKYHFHADKVNTENGAVLYFENGDDRNLYYYEVRK